jgi:hypothetical protein
MILYKKRMSTCIYENCNKNGLYENFTLCRIHKNYKIESSVIQSSSQNNHHHSYNCEIPDIHAPPIPIYCKTCDEILNCRQGWMLENCKTRIHLCKNCDECCACGIKDMDTTGKYVIIENVNVMNCVRDVLKFANVGTNDLF